MQQDTELQLESAAPAKRIRKAIASNECTTMQSDIHDTASPRVMSVRIDTLGFQQVMQLIQKFLREDRLHLISTVNPEFVMSAQRDRQFLKILNHADLNVPDGTGVQLAIQLFHRGTCERITGVDLTWAIARLSAEQGYRIFLLGAAESVAARAASKLARQIPGLIVAGCYSGHPDEEGLVERINATNPDIIFVAFGSPRQEKFITENSTKLNARIAVGVGGTFDFIAGEINRAPVWMRRAGLEWLYRLIMQPARLGRILTATLVFPARLLLFESRSRVVARRLLNSRAANTGPRFDRES